MANFKLNATRGLCDLCGRRDKDHCSVTFPRRAWKNNINTRHMRICKECGALIYKVVVTEEDYQRNRHIENKAKTIHRARKEKRKER